jgi:hypothetical protein
LPWRRFAGYRVDAGSEAAHRVFLWYTLFPNNIDMLLFLLVVALCTLGVGAALAGSTVALLRYGPRDDILASLFVGIGLVSTYAGVVPQHVKSVLNRNRPPDKRSADLVLSVSSACISQPALVALLNSCLRDRMARR